MIKFRARIMFRLCITFRLDERKRCSKASQHRHKRNCGFESLACKTFPAYRRVATNVAIIARLFWWQEGIFYYVLLIRFHYHLEP